MNLISWLSPAHQKIELLKAFPNPFSHTPHALSRQAAEQLQARLISKVDWRHDFDAVDGGKMFGVLVVKDSNDRIGFLSAFSGTLDGHWQLPGFVPPVFDQVKRDTYLHSGEDWLANNAKQIKILRHSTARRDLQVKLNNLTQQQAAELQTMKELHKRRQVKRSELRVFDNAEIVDGHDSLLAKLAFESQQDKRELHQHKAQWCEKLAQVQTNLDEIENQINDLKTAQLSFSDRLNKQLFSTYILSNRLGEKKTISQFFDNHTPPYGVGDCAAPKLIHYANQHNLKPLALAEFWWGASPKAAIRHHAHYYPPCRGKCSPILPFMLKGLELQAGIEFASSFHNDTSLEIVYEDEFLVVINKPSMLLSVPGKNVQDSVLIRLKQRYPKATGPLLVHRLDMSTSGVLLAAKNAQTHKALQQQFEQRSVEKRYVAVLSARLPENQDKGSIQLPLRVDLDDRPRQLVCFAHGKPAHTQWQVITRQSGTTRIYFCPKTGRTHQLRIHAAHKDGLNIPIVGDELYGKAGERLLLHAEWLRFTHPVTGKQHEVTSPAPF